MERNPFRIRTAEQSATQEDFLALFGSEVLKVLPDSGIWDRLLILEAAPGAGKSTILKLFTPSVLMEVARNSSRIENRALVRHLARIGALTAGGPQVLGTVVSCRSQYAAIDDLPISQEEKLRWFFGLLDARVTLLTLRSACEFVGVSFPDGLHAISIEPRSSVDQRVGRTSDAIDLYEEAAAREAALSSAIDSLVSLPEVNQYFRTQLDFLRLLSVSTLESADQIVTEHILTSFDDVQDLTAWQQQSLFKDLQNRDIRTPRWLARRLDVLPISELLPGGVTDGRDYIWCRVEDWARKRGNAFETLLVDIADRRIRKTTIAVSSFSSVLDETLHGAAELSKARAAAKLEREAVLAAHSEEVAYSSWIEANDSASLSDNPPWLAAIRWRALAMLTQRRRFRTASRGLNEPFPAAIFLKELTADIMVAAEITVAKDHNLPFYYTISRMAGLASANIEQFLRLSSAVFDRLVLLQVTGTRTSLTASEQDALVRSVSKATLDAIPRDVPFGPDVHRLISSIGTYAREETQRSSAPYAPGIVGVGILATEINELSDPERLKQRPELARLHRALGAAIAHNILEPSAPKQVKGKRWVAFYLNRLLCPAFGLPITSAQFREIEMADVMYWVSQGYRAPSRQERLPL